MWLNNGLVLAHVSITCIDIRKSQLSMIKLCDETQAVNYGQPQVTIHISNTSGLLFFQLLNYKQI